MRTLRLSVNAPQGEFLALRTKFRGYVGGYGAGKTFVGSMGICIHGIEFPGVSQAYFAPTYPQIRDIFYPTIEEVAELFELTTKVKAAAHEVELYKDGVSLCNIICRSMERPETIVGFKIGHALVDELDVMSAEKAQIAWRKILARMRHNEPGLLNGIDVTTTPEGFKTTYKIFVQDLVNNPTLAVNYGLVQASTLDNAQNLPEGYIEALVEAYPSELVDAYVNGRFVNLTCGTVYHAFNRITHASTETANETDSLYLGIDFNINNMAVSVYVVRNNGWHMVDEFSGLFDTPATILAIRARYPKQHITAYPDATGSNREAVDASRSDISLLRGAGFQIRAHSKNPSVRGRILATNRQFERLKLWVNTQRCPTATRCFEQQSYDGKGEPDKQSGFDHQNDASTYPIAYEFPIVAPHRSMRLGGI